jgi:NADH dehydrogenase
MRARIYQPAKNAMQSGKRNTRQWVLEFEPQAAKVLDPLMGWAGSTDTDAQIRMRFDSREAALAYAAKHGIDAALSDPHQAQLQIKAYADNFKSDRKGTWTH